MEGSDGTGRCGAVKSPPPSLLTTEGNFPHAPDYACNIAFRFGVPQDDKIRGCDDLKYSLTNTACQILTPITICGRDHIAEACFRLRSNSRPWAFGKVVRNAAYKFLPIREEDSRFAVIALWNPDSEDWPGFRTRTQVPGATAAVLHYNCFSRMVTTLLLRVLRLPTRGYFDDFWFFTAAATADITLRRFTRACEIFGITLKITKSEVWNIITLLGLQGTFPSRNNDMSLAIRLSPLKAMKWDDNIPQTLKDRVLSRNGIEALIGRLNFAQSATCNRFARGMLKPLYEMLYAHPYFSALRPILRRALLFWRYATLISPPPRAIAGRKSTPGFVLFTDAAYGKSPFYRDRLRYYSAGMSTRILLAIRRP